MISFARIVVVINPVSTSADQAGERVNQLQSAFPGTPVSLIRTSPSGKTATIRSLRSHIVQLGPNTLLAIAAGDGTSSLIIETLLTDPAFAGKPRKTVILPLWGGNANDLAHMLNGDPDMAKLQRVFRHGKILPVRPLEFQFRQAERDKGKRRVASKLAMCYASFGASAAAAQQLNRPGHRRKQLRKVPLLHTVTDTAAVVRSFINAPTFSITKDGTTTEIYEYIFMNGPRMAKINAMPVLLTDQKYFRVILHTKHPRSLIKLTEVVWRKKHGVVSADKHSFTVEDDIIAQFDGETMPIAAGTTIEVRLSKTPFYALSSKLT